MVSYWPSMARDAISSGPRLAQTFKRRLYGRKTSRLPLSHDKKPLSPRGTRAHLKQSRGAGERGISADGAIPLSLRPLPRGERELFFPSFEYCAKSVNRQISSGPRLTQTFKRQLCGRRTSRLPLSPDKKSLSPCGTRAHLKQSRGVGERGISANGAIPLSLRPLPQGERELFFSSFEYCAKSVNR